MIRTPLLIATVLCGMLPSCALTTRQAGTTNTGVDGSSVSTNERPNDATAMRVPAPPAPMPPPPVEEVRHFELPHGPSVCAATRPDLHETFIAFETQNLHTPEELLLLRAWLEQSWSTKLGDRVLNWDAPGCASSFLCAAVPAADAEEAAQQLVEAVSAPQAAEFYAVRGSVLAMAAEWDLTSANWKLNTTARALLGPSPGAERLVSAEGTENSHWTRFLNRESGSSKATKLPLYELQKSVAELFTEGQIIVAGPRSVTPKALTVDDAPQSSTPTRGEPQKSKTKLPPSEPVIMEENAGDWTQAAMVWRLRDPADTRVAEAALTLLLERMRREGRLTVRARVQPSGGLYTLPSIRLEGPYEDVLSSLSQLSEQHARLISTLGGPTEQEWTSAVQRAPMPPHFEPRCVTRPADGPNAAEHARRALRSAIHPAAVVWGSAQQPSASE